MDRLTSAVLLLAVLVLGASAQTTLQYSSLVGPDFTQSIDGNLYGLYFPRNVGSSAANAAIQSITLSLPPCPTAGFNCSFSNSQIASLGIVLSGIVTGSIQIGIYDDNNGAANNLLGSVTLTNGQNTTAAPIKINEVNFTTPISISNPLPTRYWVAFLVPGSGPIAPMYFRDGTACPKAANIASFPSANPGSAFNINCDNSTVYLIFVGFKTTILYTPTVLPLTFYAPPPGAQTPTAGFTLQKCPKGGICQDLASASIERVASLFCVIVFSLLLLLN